MKIRYRIHKTWFHSPKMVLQVYSDAKFYDEEYGGMRTVGWRDAIVQDFSEKVFPDET